MLMNNNEYLDLVQMVKQEIKQAQYKATLSVNKDLIILYYGIGRIINEHKSWGNKFIENLAADIKLAFPDAKGYSVRNLKYMAKFAATYEDEKFVQQAVAQIHCLDKLLRTLPYISGFSRSSRWCPGKKF